MKRLLVIAAHPDDEVLGCGGTIARFRDDGVSVRVVFLAEGITARYEPEAFEDPDVVAASDRRNNNAFRALDILGVPAAEIFVSERYCCRLDQVPQIDLVKQIEHHIRDFQPDHIFTHAVNDVNVDHRIAHLSVIAAARPIGLAPLRHILAFEVFSSTEWNPTSPFPAVVFHDIEGAIDRKVKALAAYEDEMRAPPHPRSEEVIHALAKFRGAQAGMLYAEAFAVIRQILA